MKEARRRLVVRGQVQGVGFRPFVFNLAGELGLSGFVRNSPRGVVIEIQGPGEKLDLFAHSLRDRLPPLARITALTPENIPPLEEPGAFQILQSTAGDTHAVLISPDTCTCADCLADMAAPGGRRFGYPFTNCTNCGPRYTITRSIPYDRAATSMACFPLCPECRAEYENPRDRRFHAQPNACPVCGPVVWLARPQGREEEGKAFAAPAGAFTPGQGPPEADDGGFASGNGPAWGDEALRQLAALLLEGGIAAIKGLGGFHLACDARDDAVVARLRQCKNRPHKPFAVMAAGLDHIRRFADIGPEEEALLLAPERPIVVCRLKSGQALSPLLSPDTALVGVMLPYTPLHFVLFDHVTRQMAAKDDSRPAALVMTSGNPGGQPICLGNREALAHLGSMADAFLFHNRDILIRVDDSVIRPLPDGGELLYRRARGFVPRPLSLCADGSGDESGNRNSIGGDEGGSRNPIGGDESGSRNSIGGEEGGSRNPAPGLDAQDETIHHGHEMEGSRECSVLGVGAELKNTLCLTKGDDAFVGQHIGDMANLESAVFHAEIREHLSDLLRVRPGLVVRDLHPDYLSSRMAEDLAAERGLKALALQHHAAHAFSVLAEHAFSGKALVLALDGTGLGEDGTLWGGECLLAEISARKAPVWRRLAHMSPMDLPGGEAAIREPWRIAHALLLQLGLRPEDYGPSWLPERAGTAALLPSMIARRVNCPVSTSCGRLFDAAAALLGLCDATTYEGQAAIRLEEAQGAGAWDRPPARLYDCPLTEGAGGVPLLLDTRALFAALAEDKKRGCEAADMALAFHHSLANGLISLAVDLAGRHGIGHVGLSGGCLQNVTLTTLLGRGLRRAGLTVLEHRLLPPGDGCISLGQAYWGSLLYAAER